MLAAFTTARPHRRKERIPISVEATARLPAPPSTAHAEHVDVFIDLATYSAAAHGRNTPT